MFVWLITERSLALQPKINADCRWRIEGAPLKSFENINSKNSHLLYRYIYRPIMHVFFCKLQRAVLHYFFLERDCPRSMLYTPLQIATGIVVTAQWMNPYNTTEDTFGTIHLSQTHSTVTTANIPRCGSRILQGRVSNPSETGTAPPQLFWPMLPEPDNFFGLRRNSWRQAVVRHLELCQIPY